MRLSIASLKGIQFEGEISGFNAKTASGEITILNHHRPLITLLRPGVVKILKQGNSSETLTIKGGFLEMGEKNDLHVLVD